MSSPTATAIAHPNIAFIKYWGNRDHTLRLPVNGSISMNLAGLMTQTQVTLRPDLQEDTLILNGQPASPDSLLRVSHFLGLVRQIARVNTPAEVISSNNFPTGSGIASSAAAFAALSLASASAYGLTLTEAQLSRLARRGSGSASRSVPGGFVEWYAGEDETSSYAVSIASPDFWPLADCIAVVEAGPKSVGSTEGHALAPTSPLQAARVADTPRRLNLCRQAILQRDFSALAETIEQDSTIMHAVMMSSTPPLFYWTPASLLVMKEVSAWRKSGLPVAYTLDAGPNVHCLCLQEDLPAVRQRLASLPGVRDVLAALPGGPAFIKG